MTKNKKDITNRLSYSHGHIQAIKRMVDEDVYCIDIIHQIEAVEASLKKIKEKILQNHLQTCLITAIKSDEPKKREKVLGELFELYKKSS